MVNGMERKTNRLSYRESRSFSMRKISGGTSREIEKLFTDSDFDKLLSSKNYYEAIKLCHDCLRDLETQEIMKKNNQNDKRKIVVKNTSPNLISKEFSDKIKLWKERLELVVVEVLNFLMNAGNYKGANELCIALLEAEAARVNYKMISRGLNPKLSIKEQDSNTVFTPFSTYIRAKQLEILSILESKNTLSN